MAMCALGDEQGRSRLRSQTCSVELAVLQQLGRALGDASLTGSEQERSGLHHATRPSTVSTQRGSALPEPPSLDTPRGRQ